MKIRLRREGLEGLALYIPSLLIILFVVIYPVIYAAYLSLHSYHLVRLSDVHFVGLANYISILKDPDFWASIENGLVFTFGSLIPQTVLGLAIAQLLNHPDLKAKTLWRGLIIMPWLIPTVTAAIIFRWMFNDIYGVLNYILLNLNIIDRPVAWLAHPGWAMFLLILTNIWRGLPLMVTMFLAALQGIPPELHEAATVDGASGLQAYFRVTLPLIAPVVQIAAILRTIWMFNYYDLPWVMTMGGPAGATTTPPIYAYLTTFSGYRLGQGAAITIVLFFILACFSVVYFRLQSQVE
jgi:ABC-type sugar transport system permease subunit